MNSTIPTGPYRGLHSEARMTANEDPRYLIHIEDKEGNTRIITGSAYLITMETTLGGGYDHPYLRGPRTTQMNLRIEGVSTELHLLPPSSDHPTKLGIAYGKLREKESETRAQAERYAARVAELESQLDAARKVLGWPSEDADLYEE